VGLREKGGMQYHWFGMKNKFDGKHVKGTSRGKGRKGSRVKKGGPLLEPSFEREEVGREGRHWFAGGVVAHVSQERSKTRERNEKS